jgi:hypothetical protein
MREVNSEWSIVKQAAYNADISFEVFTFHY